MKRYFGLLRDFYHIDKTTSLTKTVIQDLGLTIFPGIGSGLFPALVRGFFFRPFLNYKPLGLIGKNFKITNSSFFSAKSHLWIKDSVSMILGGNLRIGSNCVFCERSTIWSGKKGMKIGNNVAIGIDSFLCGTGESIEIGNDVLIADHVRMYTFNHNFDNQKLPMSKQGSTTGKIKIGNNVWIGSGSIILAGVTIDDNVVVGAGAVVVKNVKKGTVVAGIPAKMIKKIKK